MKIAALVGNPNVGKTTLFNHLTGSKQYVGNWAGVTVERKEGFLDKDIKIVDLPGIYALDTFSNEEKVSKNFLENDKVDVIINIIDASNLDRNLYLTTQLKQFNIPIILVLNMMDVVEKKHMKIDIDGLSKALNLTVIPMVASKDKNTDIITSIIKNNNFLQSPNDNDYHFDSEKEAYTYIEKLLAPLVTIDQNIGLSLTDKIDKIILNRFLAYPIFIGLLFLIFQTTFSWVGAPLQDLFDVAINEHFAGFVGNLLSSSSEWFQSLVLDGIIGGVGAIITFMPLIMVLFFMVSILEDSGYMARAASIMDRSMRKIGLSGKAFIPMILGFGCSVPAIMSARTLESEKDRKIAALIVPFMSCNARLPVYVLFAGIFFPGKGALAISSLYIFGVAVALIMGLIFKSTIFKKDEEPFILELPEYKFPDPKNLLLHTWDKGAGFLKKAGTLIFAVSVLVWFLSNFNFSGYIGGEDIESSIFASIGKVVAPIFAPLGFGNWQSSVALLTGIMAKEVVVSTLEIIFGNLDLVLNTFFNSVSAYAFLVFVLLYTPCVTVIGTMKKEYGGKFALISVIYQFVVAWIFAAIVYNIGSLIF